MPALHRILQQHRLYFGLFIVWLLAALVFVSLDAKIDGFLRLNFFHNNWMDAIFGSITLLGDGIFSIAVALVILFIWKHQRLALQVGIAFLGSGILAQVIKNLVRAPRPREIIDPILVSHFSKAITNSGWNSFPSGHTTSIFALATMLVLHVKKKRYACLFLVVAILVAYSRVYNGCHFPADVIAGAILGTASSVIVYLIFTNQARRLHDKNTAQAYNSQLAGHQ